MTKRCEGVGGFLGAGHTAGNALAAAGRRYGAAQDFSPPAWLRKVFANFFGGAVAGEKSLLLSLPRF